MHDVACGAITNEINQMMDFEPGKCPSFYNGLLSYGLNNAIIQFTGDGKIFNFVSYAYLF